MIKTEQEYRRSLEQIKHHEQLLAEQRKELEQMGLTEEQVERGLGPARLFQERVRAEVEEYERYKSGDFDMTCMFDNIGRQLIAFRIYRGLSQAELAKRLGVSAPQVSRDERNEYGGASMEKVKQVLKALDMEVVIVPSELNKVSV
ncbi:helix-turn-helix domain-containing protein [Paenactinomyces guangxiensis]|uniref:Helix-turn-helix domain-containing protein n=1 Tax=Paenactinomyces guangxiensis TaxID=1490290 RepID=A0A7W1WTS3_9BACL|nr:helix-turn-helix transcriptional regulator [Paenactinomyces guangxiensis]MBA4495716.1 helix-turn-helix domain-containing protein [Paenactinomyces guangxiensis]MBH8592705.1 helix-turn-helix domain-containing protein [Paenactinomyces guangxiensis]